MSLDRQLISQQHAHRFVVVPAADGWEVREEKDATVVNTVHRKDWHRVETDLYMFELRARALTREGRIERKAAHARKNADR